MFELRRTFTFESAHRLPRLPEGHKCTRLHGHSFRAEIVVRGPLDPALGWVVDFGDIKAAAGPIVDELDHRYLNEIPGLDNPTSEVVCAWLWDRLAPRLPGLHEITLHETCTSSCTYRGPAAASELP